MTKVIARDQTTEKGYVVQLFKICASSVLVIFAASCATDSSDPMEQVGESPTLTQEKLGDNEVQGDEPANLDSGPSTNANGNGQYCYNLCNNGVWYVNPRITVNCAPYGQNQVCPNRGLVWWDADWCNPSAEACPSPAVIL